MCQVEWFTQVIMIMPECAIKVLAGLLTPKTGVTMCRRSVDFDGKPILTTRIPLSDLPKVSGLSRRSVNAGIKFLSDISLITVHEPDKHLDPHAPRSYSIPLFLPDAVRSLLRQKDEVRNLHPPPVYENGGDTDAEFASPYGGGGDNNIYKHAQKQVDLLTHPPSPAREMQILPNNAVDIAKDIQVFLSELPVFDDRLYEHEFLKNKLAMLGKQRGFITKEEVSIPGGRLDLIWEYKEGGIYAAFEIDNIEPKNKSIRKLKSIESGFRYVLCRTNNATIRERDNVIVIGLDTQNVMTKEAASIEQRLKLIGVTNPIQILVNYPIDSIRAALKSLDSSVDVRNPPGLLRYLLENIPKQSVADIVPTRDANPASLVGTIEAQVNWEKALEKVKNETSRTNFDTWFKETRGLDWDGKVFSIEVSSEHQKKWLEERMYSLINRSLYSILGEVTEIRFFVRSLMEVKSQL